MTMYDPNLVALHAIMQLNLLRTSFPAFIAAMFDVLHHDRGVRFVRNWHIEAMCYELERVIAGELTRLLITVPPRHMKTICASIGLTAWMLGHRPGSKIVLVSYGKDLSKENLLNLMRVMSSPLYRRLFPNTHVKLSGMTIRTTAGGIVRATSVGGAATGMGADLIVVDDLMKGDDWNSQTARDTAWNFYVTSLQTRLDNSDKAAIVSIQQRLHEDDVAGHMIASGDYHHLNLPAIAVEEQRIPVGSGKVHVRRIGDVLFPQLVPQKRLDSLRRNGGDQFFSGQYQQNPVPPGGNRINWSHWGSYDELPKRDELELVVQSWDTGMTADPGSDYSACTTWGYREKQWYLLDVFRKRMNYGDLKRRVVHMAKHWGADRVIIENAASGIMLLRELRQEHAIAGKLRSFTPRMDKELRFETQIDRLASGKFLIPVQANWLPEFRHECFSFPRGKNDDMVDSMTQFLMEMFAGRGRAMLRDGRPEGRPRPKGQDFGRARRRA